MRVLITGVSGFVGKRLVRRLAERGDVELFGFSRSLPAELQSMIEWRSIDLTNRADVIAFVREAVPRRVFHLAAMANPGDCRADAERAFAAQVTGTAALLAALDSSAKTLLTSSSSVYGSTQSSPIPETASLDADSVYGRSKRAVERVALASAQRGRHVVIARPFNHSGAGQESRYVLPAFAKRVVESTETGEPIVTGNLFPKRDFLHVEDVLDAYELLIERGESGSAYNVARGEGLSIGELLAILQKLAGTKHKVQQAADRLRENDPEEIIGDSSRLRELGWAPVRSNEELLREVLKAALESSRSANLRSAGS